MGRVRPDLFPVDERPRRETHPRLDRKYFLVSAAGKSAVYELRAFATRLLERNTTAEEALDIAARFVRLVDQKERERVEILLRRDAGPRLTLPGRSP